MNYLCIEKKKIGKKFYYTVFSFKGRDYYIEKQYIVTFKHYNDAKSYILSKKV